MNAGTGALQYTLVLVERLLLMLCCLLATLAFIPGILVYSRLVTSLPKLTRALCLIKKGQKVGSDEAALLGKLGIRQFSNGLEVMKVYDNGSVFSPEVLNMIEEYFAKAVSNATSLALAVSYHICFINAYTNLLAVVVETDYSFPLAEGEPQGQEDRIWQKENA